jgi:ABC-type branched-subunit amino acid transport system ATPase component
MSKAIRVDNLRVQFGGVVALAGVSFNLNRGEILGILGPNGSGKSTLFNAISGFVATSSGSVTIDDQNVRSLSPAALVRKGLTRTFQTPRIDPALTARTAIQCGFYVHSRSNLAQVMVGSRASRQEDRETENGCAQIIRRLGLSEVADTPLGELPMGQVRLVDVGRGLATSPNYLLLDEPAAGLSLNEQKVLAVAIKEIVSHGVGVLLVEHNFGFVAELCQRAVVLDRGNLLVEGNVSDIKRDPTFLEMYLGSQPL